MLGTLRTLVSVAFVAALVYCSFTVDLGGKTFAEHADAIGETEPAKALVEGARETINPALEATKERILGEYVEAPTSLAGAAELRDRSEPDPSASARFERALPGRAMPRP